MTSAAPGNRLGRKVDMRGMLAVFFTIAVSLSPAPVLADEAEPACPRTTAQHPLFGAAYPGWYGTEALATQIPANGVWPTTGPGALIAVKLVWRSAGFLPGQEIGLHVTIENLAGGPVTATASRATNEYPVGDPGGLSDADIRALLREAETSADSWRMLTGMDFPDAGCWRITGEYLGQALSFVVETVPIDAAPAIGD